MVIPGSTSRRKSLAGLVTGQVHDGPVSVGYRRQQYPVIYGWRTIRPRLSSATDYQPVGRRPSTVSGLSHVFL